MKLKKPWIDFDFKLQLQRGFIECENDYHSEPYGYINIEISDLRSTFNYYDSLGISKAFVEKILCYAQLFIDKKLEKDYKLKDPYVRSSGYKINIHCTENHSDDYWEFAFGEYTSSKDSGLFTSIKLNPEDVKVFYEELKKENDTVEWDQFGKINYRKITFPKGKAISSGLCHSAKELEKIMNDTFAGKKMLYTFADALDYSENTQNRYNFIDMTMLGCEVLIVSEDKVADFSVHGEGMIDYAIYNFDDITIGEIENGYVPDSPFDCFEEDDDHFHSHYFDISEQCQFEINEHTIRECTVKPTGMCWCSMERFDKDKLSDPIELPEEVVLHLDNNVDITIGCDMVEYGWISVDKAGEK